MTSELLPDDYFIQPFDHNHAIYMGSFLIILILLLKNHRRIAANPKPVLRFTLVLSVAQQVLLYGSYIAEGFNWAEGLPLHISRVSSILGIIWLITRKSKVMDVLFFFGLYAYGSFLYPARIHPPTHPIGWSFLINHVITILLPILAVYTDRWQPTKHALGRSMLYFLLYLTAALVANEITGGNYFYMTKRVALNQLPLWQYTIINILLTYLIFFIGYYVGGRLIRWYLKRYPATSTTS